MNQKHAPPALVEAQQRYFASDRWKERLARARAARPKNQKLPLLPDAAKAWRRSKRGVRARRRAQKKYMRTMLGRLRRRQAVARFRAKQASLRTPVSL